MIATKPACRRCSECVDAEHHWIEGVPEHHTPPLWTHECKHCDAKGEECEKCQGDGADLRSPSNSEGDYPPCTDCKGSGVLLVEVDRQTVLRANVRTALDEVFSDSCYWSLPLEGGALVSELDPTWFELRDAITSALFDMDRDQVEQEAEAERDAMERGPDL